MKQKDKFIDLYGQEEWTKHMAFTKDKSDANREARRKYIRLCQGCADDEYRIYAIVHADEVLYIGCTGWNVKARFVRHKSTVKQLLAGNDNYPNGPIHRFMAAYTTDPAKLSDFDVIQLDQTKDKDTAAQLEQHYIDTFLPQMNVQEGGTGRWSKMKPSIRPLQQDNITIR